MCSVLIVVGVSMPMALPAGPKGLESKVHQVEERGKVGGGGGGT